MPDTILKSQGDDRGNDAEDAMILQATFPSSIKPIYPVVRCPFASLVIITHIEEHDMAPNSAQAKAVVQLWAVQSFSLRV
jgi:hypothetical protein